MSSLQLVANDSGSWMPRKGANFVFAPWSESPVGAIIEHAAKCFRTARRQTNLMDLWTVLLLVALMTGIMGWFVTPFCSGIIYVCMMLDGDPIDWGLEVAFSLAVPFAWVFAIMEIILLYRI